MSKIHKLFAGYIIHIQNEINCLWDTFIQENQKSMTEINNFRGYLTDVSAKTESLVMSMQESRPSVFGSETPGSKQAPRETAHKRRSLASSMEAHAAITPHSEDPHSTGTV